MTTRGATKPATVREVAKYAGVHPATVSRALNPSTEHLVRADTLQRVLTAARELNYRANEAARTLRTARSLTVGVLIPDITNPLFARILRGIDDTLEVANFTSLIAYTSGRDDRLGERIERLRDRGVDGLIVATARWGDRVLNGLASDGVPLVLVNRTTNDPTISSVTLDDAGGAQQAVEHLVAAGHRRIGFIGASPSLSTGRARLAGFKAAMKAHGLVLDDSLMPIARAITLDEGARLCREILEVHPELTAIFAANDLLAMGCYDAIRGAGLSVPKDVSVIGFNDMPFVDRFDPPMTTVRFEHYEMGALAAGILLRRLESREPRPSQVQLRTKLIARKSTARPRTV